MSPTAGGRNLKVFVLQPNEDLSKLDRIQLYVYFSCLRWEIQTHRSIREEKSNDFRAKGKNPDQFSRSHRQFQLDDKHHRVRSGVDPASKHHCAATLFPAYLLQYPKTKNIIHLFW